LALGKFNFKAHHILDLVYSCDNDARHIVQDFPYRLLASYLIVAADLGLIRDLTFMIAPVEEYFFKSDDLAFMNKLQDWLNHLTSEGMVDPKVFESCYFITRGFEIFDTLCEHFGSEDKMIYEVTANETW